LQIFFGFGGRCLLFGFGDGLVLFGLGLFGGLWRGILVVIVGRLLLVASFAGFCHESTIKIG